MDSKMIEMNNLRVLHDYLNQTLDVLVRGQRLGAGYPSPLGAGYPSPLGYSPFAAPIPGAPGTDAVYGPYGFGASPIFNGISPFAATNPFTGLPLINAGFGATSYSPFGAWQSQPWGQSPWTAGQSPWTAGQASWPVSEVARQAQVNQTLAAKTTVLEQLCRMAGIPVSGSGQV